MNKKLKAWVLQGLVWAIVLAFAFPFIAQVATYTTLAQFPTNSAGGTLNFASDALMFAFNADSHGTRQWFLSQPIGKPPLTGWTLQDGTGSSTLDTTYGYPYVSSGDGASSDKLVCIIRAAPVSTPYTVKVLIKHIIGNYPSSAAKNGGILMGFSDGTKVVSMDYSYNTNNVYPAVKIQSVKWVSVTGGAQGVYQTFGPANAIGEILNQNPVWMIASNDGTNLNFFISNDGNHTRQFDSRLKGDYLANQNDIAVCSYNNDSVVDFAVLSYSAQ